MSDPTLVRAFAGVDFLRADTLRQERGDEKLSSPERFLRNAQAWIPPLAIGQLKIQAFAQQIAAQAIALKALNDQQVQHTWQQAMAAWKHQPAEAAAMLQVLACVGEGARRTLAMWPHPVQFYGAYVLLTGCLSEMQTGEGKTLVAALAATIMAGSGAYVHVVSTNDYLAQRDCAEMQPLFRFFGLDSGYIVGGMEDVLRRPAYRQPICYASGKEIVFDYLKDRVAGHGVLPTSASYLRQWLAADQAQQPLIPALHFAIVDEADSVLIDEARTPMILSREAPSIHEPELLQWALQEARQLQLGQDFMLRPERHEVTLLPGRRTCQAPVPAQVRPAWHTPAWQEFILKQALTALHLYQLDQHYILLNGKVQIVDESTGRIMEDRTWEQGLHQLIEIKEGLTLTPGRETMVRMTFQRFFRRYYLLSGLTGTAFEAHRELWSVYRLKVRRIPPHRANRRIRQLDQCYPSVTAKWQQVVADAQQAARKGQPVLIGTRSVEASEQVSALLTQRGIEHAVLNARQDAQEASLIAASGSPGRITVATNMAGRGTDIKLQEAAKQAGGLHVILTEFHESARVDRQLFGRTGRQGDPGTTRAIVSTQDPTFLLAGRLSVTLLDHTQPGRWQRWLLRYAVWQAQRVAQRRAYRARMATLKQDQNLNQLIGFAGKV